MSREEDALKIEGLPTDDPELMNRAAEALRRLEKLEVWAHRWAVHYSNKKSDPRYRCFTSVINAVNGLMDYPRGPSDKEPVVGKREQFAQLIESVIGLSKLDYSREMALKEGADALRFMDEFEKWGNSWKAAYDKARGWQRHAYFKFARNSEEFFDVFIDAINGHFEWPEEKNDEKEKLRKNR